MSHTQIMKAFTNFKTRSSIRLVLMNVIGVFICFSTCDMKNCNKKQASTHSPYAPIAKGSYEASDIVNGSEF